MKVIFSSAAKLSVLATLIFSQPMLAAHCYDNACSLSVSNRSTTTTENEVAWCTISNQSDAGNVTAIPSTLLVKPGRIQKSNIKNAIDGKSYFKISCNYFYAGKLVDACTATDMKIASHGFVAGTVTCSSTDLSMTFNNENTSTLGVMLNYIK